MHHRLLENEMSNVDFHIQSEISYSGNSSGRTKVQEVHESNNCLAELMVKFRIIKKPG